MEVLNPMHIWVHEVHLLSLHLFSEVHCLYTRHREKKVLCFLQNNIPSSTICDSLIIIHLLVYEELYTQDFPPYVYIVKPIRGRNRVKTDPK